MDHYNHYSVEELFWDEAFRNWVLQPTREDHRQWEYWLQTHPERREVVRQARQMVLHIAATESPLSVSEKKEAIGNIMKGLSTVGHRVVENNSRTLFYKIAWIAAACILLGTAWYAIDAQRPTRVDYDRLVSKAEITLTEKVNTSNFAIAIALEDGSQITLSPKSKVSYPSRFGADKREIYLSGEAFFDITKDASRPFYVYANEVVTKVLGTSFLVRSFGDEKEVSVRVKTGRVAVFARKEPETQEQSERKELTGTIIDPNQQIVVLRESVKMTKSLIPVPEIVVTPVKINPFDFDETPVKEVFDVLEGAYSVEILVDPSIRYDCPLSANLSDLTLYEKLDLICRAVGARYEIIDGRIIIEGKGCK